MIFFRLRSKKNSKTR